MFVNVCNSKNTGNIDRVENTVIYVCKKGFSLIKGKNIIFTERIKINKYYPNITNNIIKIK
jgi:hypothetical protein